jgi:hypothetical protein
MFIYEFFLKEYIGKKKNSWTFLELKKIKKGRRVYYMVLCLCVCGSTANYSPSSCISHILPLACKKCRKVKRNGEWKQDYSINQDIHYSKISTYDEENDDIIVNYEQYYKDYYRD